MYNYNIKKNIIIWRTTLLYLAFILLSLPWINIIYNSLFKRNLVLMIFMAILLYSLFIISSLLLIKTSYSISNNSIKISNHFFGITRTKTYYFDINNIMIEKKSSILLSIFYQSKVIIYIARKIKVVSIVLDNTELDNLLSECFSINKDNKTHFQRDKDYYYNKNNYITMFINTLFIFLFSSYLYTIVLFFMSPYVNITIYYYLVYPIIFILLLIYSLLYLLHNSNTRVIYKNNMIVIKKGKLFRVTNYISLNILNDFDLIAGFINKNKYYILKYKLLKSKTIKIPLKSDNLHYIFHNNLSNNITKNKVFLTKRFIILELLITILSVPLFFISIAGAILFFLLLNYINITISILSYTIYDNDYYIIEKQLIRTRYHIISISYVDSISIKDNHLDTYRIKFNTKFKRYSSITNQEHKDKIIEALTN